MYLGVSKSQTCSVHQYKHGGLLRHKKLNENDYRKKKKRDRSVVNRSCPAVQNKPIVLNPNSSNPYTGNSSPNHRRKIVLSISALIAIGAAAFIAIGVIAVTVLNIRVRSSMSRAAAALSFSGGEDYSCSPTKDRSLFFFFNLSPILSPSLNLVDYQISLYVFFLKKKLKFFNRLRD